MTVAAKDMHILLVDDDPGVRAFISIVLTESGCRVSQACNGADALQLASEFLLAGDRLDLVFAELNMQPMGGLELAAGVRELAAELPILLAGGFIYDAHFEELQRLSRHRFLVKPFKMQEMLQYIEELMAG